MSKDEKNETESETDKELKEGGLDYTELYESFMKVKNQQNQGELNKKLIEMFDDDLKLPFNMMHEKKKELLE